MRARPEQSLLGVLALLAAAGAAAQAEAPEPSLEELMRQGLPGLSRRAEVSTAARQAQSADRSPTLTYVLTDEDIRAQGWRSLADVLNQLPGLFISSNGSFSYVGARGLGRPGDFNARVLLLIDGMRANENIYDAAQVGAEFPLDLDLIERVEFTPGPGSALYGNNAMFGVIQVISKRADKLSGARARLQLGERGLRRWLTSYGQRLESGGEWWLALGGSAQARLEPMVEPRPEDRAGVRAHNSERAQRLLGAWSQGGLSLRAGVVQRERVLPIEVGPPDAYRIDGILELNRQAYLSLRYEGRLSDDWDWQLGLDQQRTVFHSDQPFDDLQGRRLEHRSRSQGRWTDLELLLSGQPWARQRWTLGLELHGDERQRMEEGLRGQAPEQVSGGANRRLGLFLQDQLSLGARHELVLGWRYDNSRYGGSTHNPRLAWIWRPLPDASLRLQHGSAYRAANLFEFTVNAAEGRPAPQAERVQSTELAWEQSLGPGLRYSVALYHARLQDLITLSSERLRYENAPTARSLGLDLSVERRWAAGQQLSLALNLQRLRDQQGQELNNSPELLLKARLLWPLAPAWRLGWSLLAMDRRQTNAGPLPGYGLQQLNLSWTPDARGELALSVHNLADKRYFDRTEPLGPPLRREGRSALISYSRSLP